MALPPEPVSFRRDVMPVLSISGCNAGSCHGLPSGRGGFRLSLWGQDPAEDYLQLTRDTFARRVDRLDPDASLILKKALGRVPHEGGRRFAPDSWQARTLRAWVAQGARADAPTLAPLQSLTVEKGTGVLQHPARTQQLVLQARFADGTTRDATRLTAFTSSEPAVATVSPAGLVEFRRGGEVAVLCRYMDQTRSVRLTQLKVPDGFSWPNPPENNYVDRH